MIQNKDNIFFMIKFIRYTKQEICVVLNGRQKTMEKICGVCTVSFPVIQHWKRSGCCKYNDTAAGESGERNENSCNYL